MILDNIVKEACCGCSVCKASCACGAIHMKADQEGFFYPAVDSDKCIECGICDAICPVWNKDSLVDEQYALTASYIGYFLDRDKLLKSASGGAATAISEQMIRRGGVVFGVEYNDCFTPVWGMAKTLEDLEKFKGSKYAESVPGDLFPQIKQEICSGKPVLVIGLPHDVAAIRSYTSGMNADHLFLCELICNCVTSQKVVSDFIQNIENTEEKKTKSFTLRHKKDGKLNPIYAKTVFDDGSVCLTNLGESDFQYGFYYLKRKSCYHCYFKGNRSVADLTLGDYLGVSASEAYYNDGGMSLILERTKKGRQLLDMLDPDEFFLQSTEVKSACSYNHMSIRSINKASLSDAFAQKFTSEGLREACRTISELQRQEYENIMNDIDPQRDKLAIWGAGKATDDLYEKLQMSRWNIQYVFDSSEVKIGKDYKGFIVKNISDMIQYSDHIDAVISVISSVSDDELVDQLRQIGWRGKIINLGYLRYGLKI